MDRHASESDVIVDFASRRRADDSIVSRDIPANSNPSCCFFDDV